MKKQGRSNRVVHLQAAGEQNAPSANTSTADLERADSLAPLANRSQSNQTQPTPGAGRAMMTVKSAAKRMGISDSLVYELCACGSLPHVRIGRPGSRGCIRLTEDDIQEFLTSQRVGGDAPAKTSPRQQEKVFKHVVIPK